MKNQEVSFYSKLYMLFWTHYRRPLPNTITLQGLVNFILIASRRVMNEKVGGVFLLINVTCYSEHNWSSFLFIQFSIFFHLYIRIHRTHSINLLFSFLYFISSVNPYSPYTEYLTSFFSFLYFISSVHPYTPYTEY